METKNALWFSDRRALEKEYKKWAKENRAADNIFNFIAFLIIHDLIDEKKTLEFLRLAQGGKHE